jgi:hypothetical protein
MVHQVVAVVVELDSLLELLEYVLIMLLVEAQMAMMVVLVH